MCSENSIYIELSRGDWGHPNWTVQLSAAQSASGAAAAPPLFWSLTGPGDWGLCEAAGSVRVQLNAHTDTAVISYLAIETVFSDASFGAQLIPSSVPAAP